MSRTSRSDERKVRSGLCESARARPGKATRERRRSVPTDNIWRMAGEATAPEAKRKWPAPGVFKPSERSAIKGALERFLSQQDKFLGFVNEARGIDYNKTRLRSPVTPLMRYSLADALVMTVVHGQRHLAQARRVREMSGFPKA